MALTRSALREKGITEKEILDFIMDEHGNTVEAAKEKAKETAEAVAKTAIDKLQAKFDGLPEPDGEDWKARYDAEVKAHQTTKDGYAAEKDAADIDGKVSAQLKAAGMNEKAIPKALKLYDRAIVDRDKDGGIKNADKVLESFKAEWGDFFGEVTRQGADVGNPPAGGANPTQPKTLNEALTQHYTKKE